MNLLQTNTCVIKNMNGDLAANQKLVFFIVIIYNYW